MPLTGLSVPIPTLFADDGALDTGRNAKFARSVSEAKVDHLFVLGSLGEFPSVEDAERRRLLEVVIESTVGPADVWVGCGAPSTRQAIAYAEDAEGQGATAVVAVPPYYLHPSLPAVERYYRAIRASVSIPLLAYNIPSLVGYPLPPELVHRLARDGVIAGVKDTAGSLESVTSFLTGAPDGFVVMPGDDMLAGEAIRRGAAGAVMGMGNLVPRLCVELVRAARAGETDRVTECQTLVNELVVVSHLAPFPAVDKFAAAVLWGAEVGYRAPYEPLSEEDQAQVRARLGALRPRLQPFLGR
ncbi:MAG TPA: dihydrodipicolinate synthase family protein [Acidimicrobiales bacterium]|nr:dihydrodipicolinate synthase family protein [Acidimicrobiales bacterium]